MTLSEQQKKEILEQQAQKNITKRVISPDLEKILYEAIPVLDHGFVRVVDYMGDDSSIVQAARVSYGKGTKKVSTDSGLIKYLMRHHHSTPFEMCEIKYHVKLPIFIARQWIRHRTANVNEYSARYSILDKEFYMPTKDHLAAQSTSNRQGGGDLINGKQADEILSILKKDAEKTYNNYELMSVFFPGEIYFNFQLLIENSILIKIFILNIGIMFLSTLFPIYKINRIDIIECIKNED